MGGGIGYRLATAHKERINKLVLVAPISSGGIKAPESFHVEWQKTKSAPRQKRGYDQRETTYRAKDLGERNFKGCR